jgi:GT2 family glycosyltransferase
MKWREGGIGANMSFRLDVLRMVGAFDEVLGAGGPLYTCEDGDMTYRVLRAGYCVLQLPEAYVIHHGKRDWKEGQVMMYRVGVGVAAAYMKHLRLLDLAAVPLLLIEWARCISWKRLFLLQRHVGLRRFLGYARGLGISFRYDVDRQSRTYRLPQDRDMAHSHKALRLVEL